MPIKMRCASKREQGDGIFVEFLAVKDDAGLPLSKALAGRAARCSFQCLLTLEAAATIDVGGTIDISFPQK